jgi:hypothetical protein
MTDTWSAIPYQTEIATKNALHEERRLLGGSVKESNWKRIPDVWRVSTQLWYAWEGTVQFESQARKFE